MPKSQNNFLERLRTSDERMKGKVIIVATALLMIIVLFLWFLYFNAILSS